jgi:glycyl-tRNA synthetase (class II)
MAWKATGATACAIAAIVFLAGCKDGSDYNFYAHNDSDETLTFRIEFTEPGTVEDLTVEPGEATLRPLDSCEAAHTVVSTLDARLSTEIHEPMCPNWHLVVDETLKLHYVKGGRFEYAHMTVPLTEDGAP